MIKLLNIDNQHRMINAMCCCFCNYSNVTKQQITILLFIIHWIELNFKILALLIYYFFCLLEMNSTREIITLQIGDYSNFIGTHFWNLQVFIYINFVLFHLIVSTSNISMQQEASFSYDENPLKPSELCHDVLYREGVNLKVNKVFV